MTIFERIELEKEVYAHICKNATAADRSTIHTTLQCNLATYPTKVCESP